MKKFKMLLIPAALAIAIGGAFATTLDMDPCETEAKYEDPGLQTPLTGSEVEDWNCVQATSQHCFYVQDPNTAESIPCRSGTRLEID
ncbi:DUF6520 family protein [Sphingobacterium humi]|uniref:Uncharacterized protein n=1 Tax=Sphingobacterium humi TaxID=1796905 RepID=A0A6N8L217_9SPHI|nr:DUF6520 family protein [Sphingobacterium humi]MVZ63763.1 hypothetical protein [Sphingobacterium humi]